MLHWDVAFGGLWDTIVADFKIAPHSIFIIIGWIVVAAIWSYGTEKSIFRSMLEVLGWLIFLAVLEAFSVTLFYIVIVITLAICAFCTFAK